MSNQFGMHAGQYRNEHTKEQNQQFTAQFSELTARFVAAMSEGQSLSDESVQTLVKRHYDFCRNSGCLTAIPTLSNEKRSSRVFGSASRFLNGRTLVETGLPQLP
jgi:hypothetical protein